MLDKFDVFREIYLHFSLCKTFADSVVYFEVKKKKKETVLKNLCQKGTIGHSKFSVNFDVL